MKHSHKISATIRRVRFKLFISDIIDFFLKPFRAIRTKYRKYRVNNAIRILDNIDWHMKEAGWTRLQRRQFWRDYIKRHKFRTEVLNRVTQQ